MYQRLLNKFFRQYAGKNTEIPTAAAIAHFQIKIMSNPELNQGFRAFTDEVIFKEQPEREKKALEEKTEIESASCEQIIRIMRRSVDPMNLDALVACALSYEAELVPEVLRRLKTSLNTNFIEVATRVLSLCKTDITDELTEGFDDIRDPYAKCMVLVVLGFKADEALIPWLIEKHDELKRLYPNDGYHEGAYYALFEIENRFYSNKKRS